MASVRTRELTHVRFNNGADGLGCRSCRIRRHFGREYGILKEKKFGDGEGGAGKEADRRSTRLTYWKTRGEN